MTFEAKKYDAIVQDLKARTAVLTDFQTGSVTRTLYETLAYELALLHEKLHQAYLAGFVDTANGGQLDMVVSILGIRRGLPDYAEGVVTFEASPRPNDLPIPMGTLVTTAETPAAPKKAYETVEAATLAAGQASVDVKVRAASRGEGEVTPAETIVVMPRPLAGVRSVINHAATRFHGKRRESDAELRQRAKNALLGSGRASLVAIENVLLRLEGVRDARVFEPYRFARGDVTVTRSDASEELLIPRGTPLTGELAPLSLPFETRGTALLAAGESSLDVAVRALIDGEGGAIGAGATWQGTGPLAGAGVTIANAQPIETTAFGVIEVYVDGVDLSVPSEEQRLRAELDAVRAAGILALLKATEAVTLDGVVRVTAQQDASLSADDRAALEEAVRAALEAQLAQLRMGEHLLLPQVVKNVLSVEGVDNLEDFRLTSIRAQGGGTRAHTVDATAKRLDVDEFERFAPRFVCVASETKSLPVSVRVRATGLSAPSAEAAEQALAAHLGGLGLGATVEAAAVEAALTGAGLTVDAGTLELTAKPWCEHDLGAGPDIAVTFVEQPALGSFFAYEHDLDLVGALALTLPFGASGTEAAAAAQAALAAVEAALAELGANEPLELATLEVAAKTVPGVLAAAWEADDFSVERAGAPVPGRVKKGRVTVEDFERLRAHHLLLTHRVESVAVAATAVAVELMVLDPPPVGFDAGAVTAQIKDSVAAAFNSALTGFVADRDVPFGELKARLESLVPGASYRLIALAVEATSADGRVQTSSLTSPAVLQVRSVELAVIEPALAPAAITVTQVVLPQPE